MNKGMVIGAVVVLLVVVLAGAYLLSSGSKASPYTSTVSVTSSSPTTVVQASTTAPPTTASTTVVAPTNVVSTSNSAYSVNIETSAKLGSYLANQSGFTLYTLSSDVPGSGVSTCTSSCISDWPAFYTANLVIPKGLNASAFNTIVRTGGQKQLTYNGWPLYLFVADKNAGDINGNGVGNFKLATISSSG
jgi:predicted lipoprotein with Yx(FWY)xxD motif